MKASFIFIILLSLIFVAPGCKKIEQGRTVVQIDNIKVSKAEFDAAFKMSPYAYQNTFDSRKKFMDNLISTKLILREAEKTGLDKDPEFLKGVEEFWQQALLKLTLNKKVGELTAQVAVGDNEIKEYYERYKQEKFPTDELPAVSENIKWLLIKEKQGRRIQEWIDSLRKKAKVRVNERLSGIVGK